MGFDFSREWSAPAGTASPWWNNFAATARGLPGIILPLDVRPGTVWPRDRNVAVCAGVRFAYNLSFH